MGYVNLSRVIFMVVISDNHDVTIGNKYVIDINMIGLEASVCNITYQLVLVYWYIYS